jgi:hypothetical protein
MPQRDSGPVATGDRHADKLKRVAPSKSQEPSRDPYEDQAERKQIADDHSPPPPDAEWRLDPPRAMNAAVNRRTRTARNCGRSGIGMVVRPDGIEKSRRLRFRRINEVFPLSSTQPYCAKRERICDKYMKGEHGNTTQIVAALYVNER